MVRTLMAGTNVPAPPSEYERSANEPVRDAELHEPGSLRFDREHRSTSVDDTIVITLPYSIREITGVGRVVQEISRGIERRGFGTLWILPDAPGSALITPPARTVLHEIPVRNFLVFGNVALAAETFRKLLITRNRIALIHAHTPHLQTLAALFAARILNVPCVVTFHGIHPRPRHRGRRLVLSWLESLTLRLATEVTAVSEATRDALRSPRIRVIPNGVEILRDDRTNRDDTRQSWGVTNETVLLFAGRFAESKGLEVILQAVAKLVKEERLEVRLVLVGMGASAEVVRLREIALTLGIQSRIIFEPATEDHRKFLDGADLFLLPSYYEGMPLGVLDAMMAGLPVIASKVGGIPEMIREGVDGRLVPAGDANFLAAVVSELVRNPILRQEMASRARKRAAESFSAQEMIAGYEAVYSRLVPPSSGKR